MKKIKITLEETTKKDKYSKYPRIDIDQLAFASPADADKMQMDYIDKIRKIIVRRSLIVIILIALCLFGLAVIGGYSIGAYASPYSSSVNARNYVLNKHTKRFHHPSCKNVKDIAPANRRDVKWERTKAISHGYSPCGNCNP